MHVRAVCMYLYTVDTGMHDARFTEDGLSVLAGCSSALLHVCSAEGTRFQSAAARLFDTISSSASSTLYTSQSVYSNHSKMLTWTEGLKISELRLPVSPQPLESVSGLEPVPAAACES